MFLIPGEVLSEGIGRPAPVVSPGRSLPPRTVLLPGAGPSLQALIVACAPAIRSVATYYRRRPRFHLSDCGWDSGRAPR